MFHIPTACFSMTRKNNWLYVDRAPKQSVYKDQSTHMETVWAWILSDSPMHVGTLVSLQLNKMIHLFGYIWIPTWIPEIAYYTADTPHQRHYTMKTVGYNFKYFPKPNPEICFTAGTMVLRKLGQCLFCRIKCHQNCHSKPLVQNRLRMTW